MDVQPVGNRYACREARRQARLNYKIAHPGRVGMATRSKHRLSEREGTQAICAICGPVEAVVKGRGYMCRNRAHELGWTVFEEQPAPGRCPVCRTWRLKTGECPSCVDPIGVSTGLSLMLAEWGRRQPVDTWIQDDLHYAHEKPLPEYESVVPRWKTLGSDKSWTEVTRVRPEYAALYGG